MPKFTTPCFIRKNTPELRKKLEELDYINRNPNDYIGDSICTLVNHNPYRDYEYMCFELDNDFLEVIAPTDSMIDCGTNERLFLALAALREDSDNMQWFYYRNCPTSWYQSEDDICKYYIVSDGGWLKATPSELIEHFKEK